MQNFSLPLQTLGFLQGRLSGRQEIQGSSHFKPENTPLHSERGVFYVLQSLVEQG